MVEGSKIKIKPEQLVYSIMGMPRIIHKITKIIQLFITIILWYIV